ncbi:family 2 putative glycosyltransferase [Achaetomium macrosporum]|uniref:chitin synthase n=1 Tax=Achaetomium macrosporum TaxID=79813 RepID=A0AAN7C784_9PEZI|nr:family 2 putative glycosyltransferase [Achaetomium macrosporum]
MAVDIEESWPVNEIVYTAIVGVVMLAAFLEWFLWIAAFLYCLWKVFVKAEHWTVRLLAALVGIAFTLLRCIFLPIMVVTLPLPSQIARVWPPAMVSFLQWFAFWSFAGLLTIPWLFCVYQIVTHQLGRTKRIKQILDEVSAPKVVIVMPCYKEEPDVLVTAINSVVDCDYPPSCIHVFLSFDGDQEDELYLNTIEKLGVPLTLESYPKSIDVTYKAARITVSRFPHGGKRHCQKMTFKLIDKVYYEYLRRNDNLFILFIDSDCILDRVCLQNFVYDMELSPGNRRDMLAMTGVITSTTRKHSLITLLQDMEYIHGQLFERTVESGCGAVTCLPGALTMLRFSAFRRMAKYYFADKAEQCEDLFDFAKSHLGEDRWLTHLFMIGAKKRYQIQMCTSAFCKTEAVQTMRSLIKQRRRWFLGFITNEVCMLTDWRLWKRYPILVLVRFMQNTIRTTALLFFIMVLALMTTTKKVSDLPVGFIAISLGLNWLMMIYFGAKLRRFKIWLYPMMFVLNPFFNWYYMVYGIFTAGQRTWGGPRADAAAADAQTTAQEAIEQAEQTGDDLNIVPESFIPAAQEREELAQAASKETSSHQTKKTKTKTTKDSGGPSVRRSRSILQPPDKVVGKFAPPERTPSGWYRHPDDSMASHVGKRIAAATTTPPAAATPTLGGAGGPNHHHQHLHHPQGQGQRDSFDSTFSTHTTGILSVYMPQRVESIMGDEDRRKYELAQASQISHFLLSSSRIFASSSSSPPSPSSRMAVPSAQGQGQGQVFEVPDDSNMDINNINNNNNDGSSAELGLRGDDMMMGMGMGTERVDTAAASAAMDVGSSRPPSSTSEQQQQERLQALSPPPPPPGRGLAQRGKLR